MGSPKLSEENWSLWPEPCWCGLVSQKTSGRGLSSTLTGYIIEFRFDAIKEGQHLSRDRDLICLESVSLDAKRESSYDTRRRPSCRDVLNVQCILAYR